MFTSKCNVINFTSNSNCLSVDLEFYLFFHLFLIGVSSDGRSGQDPYPPAVRPQQADLQGLWGASGGARHRTKVGLHAVFNGSHNDKCLCNEFFVFLQDSFLWILFNLVSPTQSLSCFFFFHQTLVFLNKYLPHVTCGCQQFCEFLHSFSVVKIFRDSDCICCVRAAPHLKFNQLECRTEFNLEFLFIFSPASTDSMLLWLLLLFYIFMQPEG